MSAGWILATRSEEDLASLAAALVPHGLDVVAYPVLHDEPVGGEAGDLEHAVARCARVAFTSRRAPAALRRVAGPLWGSLLRLPAAAVGTATAAAAVREGFRVEVVGHSGGEALADVLAGRLAEGDSVLHPCGLEHRKELGETLAARGIEVVPVVVYRVAETAEEGLPVLPTESPRAVLLTSPRAARAYLRASGGRYSGVPHVAFGATTAAAAAAAGLAARPLADRSEEAIVEELCRTCS